MKTLLEHLNQVSKERWFKNFRHATDDGRVYMVESIIKEAGKRYAKEVAREALKNAIIKQDEVLERFAYRTHGPFAESLRESILDDKNIPEL